MVWRAASSTSNFSLKWYENYFHEICSDDSFVCVWGRNHCQVNSLFFIMHRRLLIPATGRTKKNDE